MSAPVRLKSGISFHGPGNCQKPIALLRATAKIPKAKASSATSIGEPGEPVAAARQAARPSAPAIAAPLQAVIASEAHRPAATSAAPIAASAKEGTGVFAVFKVILRRLQSQGLG